MKKYFFVILTTLIIGYLLGGLTIPPKINKIIEIVEVKDTHTVTLTHSPNPVPTVTVTVTETKIKTNPVINIGTKKIQQGYVELVPEQFFWHLNKKTKWEKIQIPQLAIPRKRRHPFEMGVEGTSWAAFSLLCKSNNAGRYDGVDWNFLKWLDVKPTDTVADIGAGTGKYTFALADRAKKVYANDLGPSFPIIIDWINQLSANGFFEAQCGQDKKHYNNITAYVGDIDDAKIPEKCDLILLHQVHAFLCKPPSNAEKIIEDKFLKSLINKLKHDGKIIIIEHEKVVENQRTSKETIDFFTQKKYNLKCQFLKYPDRPGWNIFVLEKDK